MKYSAAFVVPVMSEPDRSAYSVHFFLQGSCRETDFQVILNKTGNRGLMLPCPRYGGGRSMEVLRAGGTQTTEWEARTKPTAPRSWGSPSFFGPRSRREQGGIGKVRKPGRVEGDNISHPFRKHILMLQVRPQTFLFFLMFIYF